MTSFLCPVAFFIAFVLVFFFFVAHSFDALLFFFTFFLPPHGKRRERRFLGPTASVGEVCGGRGWCPPCGPMRGREINTLYRLVPLRYPVLLSNGSASLRCRKLIWPRCRRCWRCWRCRESLLGSRTDRYRVFTGFFDPSHAQRSVGATTVRCSRCFFGFQRGQWCHCQRCRMMSR